MMKILLLFAALYLVSVVHAAPPCAGPNFAQYSLTGIPPLVFGDRYALANLKPFCGSLDPATKLVVSAALQMPTTPSSFSVQFVNVATGSIWRFTGPTVTTLANTWISSYIGGGPGGPDTTGGSDFYMQNSNFNDFTGLVDLTGGILTIYFDVSPTCVNPSDVFPNCVVPVTPLVHFTPPQTEPSGLTHLISPLFHRVRIDLYCENVLDIDVSTVQVTFSNALTGCYTRTKASLLSASFAVVAFDVSSVTGYVSDTATVTFLDNSVLILSVSVDPYNGGVTSFMSASVLEDTPFDVSSIVVSGNSTSAMGCVVAAYSNTSKELTPLFG